MATKQNGKQSSKSKKKLIIFAVEIIIILIMVGALYLVMSHTDPETEGPKITVLEPEKLEIPEEIVQEKEEGGAMKGYLNIALFGVDAQTDKQLLIGSRSDSTMIASVNLDTGDIKLVSVYRDTYLNVGKVCVCKKDCRNEEGEFEVCGGEVLYSKSNRAYFEGGAEQAVQMLNRNLDMDIENFITVGYKGLSEIIDGLGGVYIDVDSVELQHINNYQDGIAEVLGCSYENVTETGVQLLNGIQATAYCRIRQTRGDDFKRTARQREVLKAIEEQAKKADYATLSKVFNAAIGDIYTSLDTSTILELLKSIANYRIADEGGFPEESMRTTGNIGATGSCVIPLNLEKNVVWLHEFLFEDMDYEVTESVIECSEKVEADTTPYLERLN